MPKGIPHTTDTFIKQSNQVHNLKYDYSKVDYKTNIIEVIIKCSVHGNFNQKPIVHLRGGNCPKCMNELKSINYKGRKSYNIIDPTKHLEIFIKRSNKIHNNYYDYSKTNFANRTNDNKLIIICPKHGEFLQRHYHHWGGAGCPKCSSKYKKQNKWLDSLNIPDTPNTRQVRIYLNDGIGGEYIVSDGYIKETKTIYEFWGNYHHGKDIKNQIHFSGKTMKELLKETNLKRRRIKNAGYNLIEIWEDEWDL